MRAVFLFFVFALSIGPTIRAWPSVEEWFSEATRSQGIDFVHFNGMSGEYYFPEIVGAGGAFFDYDNDGDLDLYLVQGHMIGPDKELSQALFPPVTQQPLTDRLYRNDLVIRDDGARALRFTDVTKITGINGTGYGMGVTAGDFDSDGWMDLYITNYGRNQLLHNNGDGTFSDVTDNASVDDPRWSVSAALLDYDFDGWLDLFVGNYLDFNFADHEPCYAPDGTRDYCSPLSFRPVAPKLFRNLGDGSFEDASASSGVIQEYGGALGVVTADFDGNGWIDIYVANDGRPNQLWLNQKDGTTPMLASAAPSMLTAAPARNASSRKVPSVWSPS